jgi:hypothetical protein
MKQKTPSFAWDSCGSMWLPLVMQVFQKDFTTLEAYMNLFRERVQ